MKPPTSQTQPPVAQAVDMAPGLYIVATPIGNLKDITLRALEVLAACDLIACEDTRVTAKLLTHYGVKAPTLSYNDHNGESRRPKIMEALQAGKRVALVSDAGTPLISDPGYKLVRDCQEAGYNVTALPGASSLLAGLCLSGLPTDRFCFAGFLPPKEEARFKTLQTLSHIPATLVFFEAARRVPETLASMAKLWGSREAAVTRELTKLYEETRRGTVSELAAHYASEGEPRGEVVIIVSPPGEEAITPEDMETRLSLLLKNHSVKEAATILAEQTGHPRKELYTLALKLMQDE
ncbi:MAG: 16S rRNA (cytidine(1402)-2'-O)-methyltransferase [Rickettsiales bacterium]|nr:16S rRNA (cytidine(1402)-2'-O)-methyltransferase [Rickettsiales bacterium]